MIKNLIISFLTFAFSQQLIAQYPTGCGAISARNNSNGQATSCGGVSGTAIASNFTGTPYTTVPAGAKTADITFKYLNVNYLTLKPYAIAQITQTLNGVTTVINSPVGPASVPTLTGSNDALVKYCVYVTNIPTSGTLNFQLVNPETGDNYGACFYDASCNANCNSTGFVLSLVLNNFQAKKTSLGVILEWNTSQETGIKSFEIEKSRDGRIFEKIAEKSAVGTGSGNYSHADASNNQPISFYRLKILENNGTYYYSDIVQVKDMSATFTIQKINPNPFVNDISIEANIEKAEILYIQVLDLNGKEVAKKQVLGTAGHNIIRIENLAKLSKGMYVLKISYAGNVVQQKLIK